MKGGGIATVGPYNDTTLGSYGDNISDGSVRTLIS